ncbi:hypothetical protein LTR84_000543 [Exophiala bonariae]|uniref:Dystroglycan-type cadherin-like domain-containing protein n=1 Tax=Exophiala bonariae TaxID=1690606 RepID=A0AAV9NQU0_9EURO|nr:hypothetical protein LTR84_000543 [Exophiala bonariae]
MPLNERKTPSLGSLFTLLIKAASCVPYLSFPISFQVPPVAYASLPFDFQFAATTFTSTGPQVLYGLSNGPEWLNLDTIGRRLYGTPHADDVGATTFQLTASDVAGATTTSVALVVLDSMVLTLREPITAYLAEPRPASSSPHSLFLRPAQPFTFKFDRSLFGGSNADTEYYAISEDNSPLPSWLQFDVTELLFSGDSPPLRSKTAPAQRYGFRLIASNIAGFAEAIAKFDVIIDLHILAFTNPSYTITLTAGEPLDTIPLRDLLMLDDRPISDDEIARVVIDGPPWVELNASEMSLSGYPKSQTNTIITISVTDVFRNSANATWSLDFEESPIVSLGVVADIEVSAGQHLQYTFDIPPKFSSMQIDLDHEDGLSWLKYNATNMTIYGDIPSSSPTNVWNVSISFQNATVSATGVVILRVTTSIRPTTTTSTVDETNTPSGPSTSLGATITSKVTPNRQASDSDWNPVLLAVCLSVVGFIVVCLIFLLVLYRHQKRRKDKDNTVDNATPSRPTSPNENGTNGLQPLSLLSLTSTIEHPEPVRSNLPLRPPRIDLAWSNDSLQKAKSRISGSRSSEQQRMSRLFNVDSNAAGPKAPQASTQVRNARSRGGSSLGEWQPFPLQDSLLASSMNQPIASTSLSCIRGARRSLQSPPKRGSIGLPDRRSGAGHGSGIISDTGMEHEWGDPLTPCPVNGKHRSTVALESFPLPPSEPASATARSISPFGVLFESIEGSLSFEAERQKWHTERARARLEGAARFSNRGSSRLISASRYNNHEKSKLGISTLSGGSAMEHHHEVRDQLESREHSWSKWSGTGPAAQDLELMRSPLGNTEASMINRKRGGSTASSRQFDSVASSGSLWEDESPSKAPEITGARLPFSPLTQSQENMSGGDTEASLRQERVADKRKPVNVENRGLRRVQSSQQGSLSSLRYV